MTTSIITRSYVVFTCFLSLWSCECFRYDKFSGIDIMPQKWHHVEKVKQFSEAYQDDEVNFQFVRPPYKTNVTISVICSPMARERLETFLSSESIPYSVPIQDYQRLIDRESRANLKIRFEGFLRGRSNLDHASYLGYKQIEDWLFRKTKTVPYASFTKFGETFEKRKLFMIKISKNSSLPIVWIDSGIHAREWISISSVLYVTDMLLKNSQKVNEILAKFQFVIVPVVNPDGYEYSHKVFRLWRKNRSISNISSCIGVDLNRNFPYDWEGTSSSTYPCSDQYKGVDRASEKEIQSIINAMTRLKDDIKLVTSVHSYGQLILQPFHFSSEIIHRNYLDMTSIALRAAFNVLRKHGATYRVGRAPDILYSASGSSNDFTVGTLNIPFSFTIELPDKGHYGFILPPDFIRPVGRQLWDMLYSLTNDISNLSTF